MIIFCESVYMLEWTPSSWILSRLVLSWPFLPPLFLEYLINVFCVPSLEKGSLHLIYLIFYICILDNEFICMIYYQSFLKILLLLFAPFHQIPIVPPSHRSSHCKNLGDLKKKKCNQMQKVLISTQPHQIQHLIKCESIYSLVFLLPFYRWNCNSIKFHNLFNIA